MLQFVKAEHFERCHSAALLSNPDLRRPLISLAAGTSFGAAGGSSYKVYKCECIADWPLNLAYQFIEENYSNSK